MKKKYFLPRKSKSLINNPNDQIILNCLSSSLEKKDDPMINNNKILKFELYSNDNKHERKNSIAHSNCKIIFCLYQNISYLTFLAEWETQEQNRLSEKLLLNSKDSINPTETSLIQKSPPFYRERLSSNQSLSRSSVYSQKMCIQLQITISLLAISICFIFCTLPNCISTIMIQTHNQNEEIRKFWQAMNYLSIVPLLTTHSVNLIFYYLSSNTFRNRFKENYMRKTNSTKHFSLRSSIKS